MAPRVLFGIAVALGLSSSVAQAQMSGGQWRLPPQGTTSGTAKGVAAKPQVVTVIPVQPSTSGFFPAAPAQPIAATFVPAILMSDGSVFANFGFGYERVLRSCSSQSVVVTSPVQVVAGNGTVLSGGSAKPTFTQPVPNAINSQRIGSSQSATMTNGAARTACFSFDGSGRVFVFR